MNTPARTNPESSSHWYYPDARPCYEVPYADPSKGMRPTTLRDARKLGLLPSVTTVLRVLNRPALTAWLIEQACLTVLTAPRLENEPLDAFVTRVLQTERQQDAEAREARDLGTDIHEALELAVQGCQCDENLRVYVDPVLEALKPLGAFQSAETVVVGDGYAGKTDLILTDDEWDTIVDFKSAKKLPKEAYPEHKLQLSGYAAAHFNKTGKSVRTFNIYISTEEPGKIAVHPSGTMIDYEEGFVPALHAWQWMNQFWPEPKMAGLKPITTVLADVRV